MRVREEFSKYAATYAEYNVIQTLVAKKLLSSASNHHKTVLDLGCGSGTLYKLIDFPIDRFVGVDFSAAMLQNHPKNSQIDLIEGDFNDRGLFEKLKKYRFDQIYSSSALQWASDMENVAQSLSDFQASVALGIFTEGTFKTLYETASLSPILKSADDVHRIFKRYFPDANFELIHYSLEFDNVREMFRYIKRSGVSAGRRVLDYKQTKMLLKEYPSNVLEFEVLFITTG